MYNKFLLKKKNEKKVSELVLNTSEKYYCKLKNISNIETKMIFISIISEISNSIFDFYIDVNRTNNVFYVNVNELSQKLIDEIFILNCVYCYIKVLDNIEPDEKDMFLDTFFMSFKFSKKNKKFFNKCYDMYHNNNDTFMIHFINTFAKKVFSTKKTDRMEFIYINHYLETSFNSFFNSYESFFV